MTEKSKKMKKSTKWFLGCGLTLLLGIAVLIGGTYFMFWIVTSHHENELKFLGFSTVLEGRVLGITTPITEQQLLKGVVVQISADCQTNIAVLAHTCVVNSSIKGDLYFRGHSLVLTDTAHISGRVESEAKIIRNLGTVDGGIHNTGKNAEVTTLSRSDEEKSTEPAH